MPRHACHAMLRLMRCASYEHTLSFTEDNTSALCGVWLTLFRELRIPSPQGAGLEGPSPIVAAGSPVSKRALAASSPAIIDVLLHRMDRVREGITALSRHFDDAG